MREYETHVLHSPLFPRAYSKAQLKALRRVELTRQIAALREELAGRERELAALDAGDAA